MRARQRHFNPVHAGANTSLDGRFISGLADDAAMSSWTGRAGSGLTPAQATSGNQPKYKVAAINSLPGVYFDDAGTATSAKFFQVTTSVTSNAASYIAVTQKSANVATATYARVTSLWNTANNAQTVGDYGSTNSMLFIMLANDSFGGFNPSLAAFRNSAALAAHSYTVGDNIIASSTIDGTTVTVAKNGITATGTTSATALNSDAWRIGAAPYVSTGANGNMRGYVARLDFFISAIPAPLRRRCERSAAYCFKIACS